MSKKLNIKEVDLLINKLSKEYRVFAPSAEFRGGRFSDTDNITYKEVSKYEDIVWDKKSHSSPKETVLPITQTLFWFSGTDVKEAEVDTRPILVFLRSCDVFAFKNMDYMYLKNGGKDSYYEKLRTKLKFALLECRTSFENCFCASMGTNQTDDFSLAVRFSEEGGEFLVKDDELAPYFDDFAEKSEFYPEFVQDNPTKVKTPDTVCDDPRKVRKILTDNDMWNQYDKRCIACGRCTTSCPTCGCYNVFDVIYNKNHKVGERRRQHASCMISGYTEMAGGHKFRENNGEKLRYRALHMANDFKAREGNVHQCVGCGRCDDQCPHYISFSNILNKMTEVVEEEVAKEKVQVKKV